MRFRRLQTAASKMTAGDSRGKWRVIQIQERSQLTLHICFLQNPGRQTCSAGWTAKAPTSWRAGNSPSSSLWPSCGKGCWLPGGVERVSLLRWDTLVSVSMDFNWSRRRYWDQISWVSILCLLLTICLSGGQWLPWASVSSSGGEPWYVVVRRMRWIYLA